jgi:Tfp pilus assembly protein PilN
MSQQINLLNPAFLKQRRIFSLMTMVQGMGLVLIFTVLVYVFALYQVSGLNALSDQSSARLKLEQESLIRDTASYSPGQVNQQLKDELQQWGKKVEESDLLVERLRSGSVGNTSGFSEYLRAFSRQVVPGLWLTGFKVTGDAASIRLSGRVTDPAQVPAYITKLGSESIMQGKRFANLQMQSPKTDVKGSAPHYLEFTLYSLPDSEEKQ